MKTPAFTLTLGGQSITGAVGKRLISLSLTDKRAFEADQLSLTLDDADGRLALPSRGVEITLALGWADSGVIDKGRFIVDEAGHSGPPDQITVTAHSAGFYKSLGEQKRRSFANLPLGDVLKTIAGEHGLGVAISETLGWKNVGHIDQTDESDGHLLTRLGRRFDALATIKDGRIVFLPIGAAKSASGKSLSGVLISREDGDRHTYQNLEGQTDFTGVRANWHSTDDAETHAVTVEDQAETPKLKTLRQTYGSEQEAREAATAEWNKIKRGRHTMQLSLAYGRPEIMPEVPVHLAGWKTAITGRSWIAGEVTHSLDASGLTTSLELEDRP